MDELLDYDTAVDKYDPVFGIECHVELSTKTKMFCPAEQSWGAPANSQTTPVSLGLPGSLPVLNEQALNYAIKIGLALNCQIAEISRFARKNYFYPDLTKNYQISQSDQPIAVNGYLDVEVEGQIFRIEIERAHMEEDAGKNTHVGGATGRIHGADYALIDYNRAGVPLVEIVTRPIVGAGSLTPQVAAAYVKSLRDIFVTLGVSEAKMERGNLRADVNLSLSPKNSGHLGTRTETKNVNSFRSIDKACVYEIRRQAYLLEAGLSIVQETRHFHEENGETSSGRIKSDSDDYRYFPDPDLVPIITSAEQVEAIRQSLPELPAAKRQRLQKEWQFTDQEMRDVVNAGVLDLVEQTVQLQVPATKARKWWLGEISKFANESNAEISELNVTPSVVVELERLIETGTLNDKLARSALEGVLKQEGNLSEVVEKRSLRLVSDTGLIETAVEQALADNPDIATRLRAGDMKPLGVIIGKVMKSTQGKADAQQARAIIQSKLSS
ncbi:MAG: Asp-tRNA(Asn)/Glu-tRNA(Gln) amidotransferase subunit GatB [Bifidobacteriaceae bacterium]|jgi:aspartyl-tRNA(Asn)/glutamyl-tRNA(Gln) amidotransferase subunit B|nr:Asp-tRNA(Asn)/Glu-tRNA(Gln) amidotransferase subunit GatB [Bifidobacteriaceae bacterium]